MSRDFAHLHLHSIFSLLDGTNKIPDLVKRVKELGMSSVALTDHGWLGGVLDFYKECKKQGVKPLLGMEAYITSDPDGLPKDQRKKDNHHLVMIATSKEGYENLLYLASNASINNFYYKPRIWKERLAERSRGIIATSACLGGFPGKCGTFSEKCYSDPSGTVSREVAWYRNVFEGRYYLEIQDNPDIDGQQEAYNHFVIQMGKELNIPTVITSDAHYLKKEDKGAHDLIMAMQTKKTLTEYLDPSNNFKYGPWFYVRSGDEMWEATMKYNSPESFENTLKIASECNVELELGKYKPPVFDISNVPDRAEFETWLTSRHEEDHETIHTITG